jgi:hypothetical protein
MRYHLVHSLTREQQVFLNHLFFKFSAFNLEVDTSAFGHAITELLLEAYSLDEIAQMPLEDLAKYLQTKGRGRFSDPEDVASSIQKAARDSYRLSKCVEDSIDLILGSSIESSYLQYTGALVHFSLFYDIWQKNFQFTCF